MGQSIRNRGRIFRTTTRWTKSGISAIIGHRPLDDRSECRARIRSALSPTLSILPRYELQPYDHFFIKLNIFSDRPSVVRAGGAVLSINLSVGNSVTALDLHGILCAQGGMSTSRSEGGRMPIPAAVMNVPCHGICSRGPSRTIIYTFRDVALIQVRYAGFRVSLLRSEYDVQQTGATTFALLRR